MNLVDLAFIYDGTYYVVIAHEALLCRCQYYDTDWAMERTKIFATRDVLKLFVKNDVPMRYQ